jgi:hypothetical protein
LWYVGHAWDGCSVAYSFCSSIPCLCNDSYKKQKGKKEENSLPQKDQTSWKHTNVCLSMTWLESMKALILPTTHSHIYIYIYMW